MHISGNSVNFLTVEFLSWVGRVGSQKWTRGHRCSLRRRLYWRCRFNSFAQKFNRISSKYTSEVRQWRRREAEDTAAQTTCHADCVRDVWRDVMTHVTWLASGRHHYRYLSVPPTHTGGCIRRRMTTGQWSAPWTADHRPSVECVIVRENVNIVDKKSREFEAVICLSSSLWPQ